jgi:hypothetical protein
MKFRIKKIIHDVAGKNCKTEFIIEKKIFLKWEEIRRKEISSERISFATQEEAEKYLINKYTGHGEMQVLGNLYIYKKYSYNFC